MGEVGNGETFTIQWNTTSILDTGDEDFLDYTQLAKQFSRFIKPRYDIEGEWHETEQRTIET